MKKYVDGYVIPIKLENVEKYRKMAEKVGKIWIWHGALRVVECVGDDLNIEKGVSFNQSAGALNHETVIFSWIEFDSKEHRDKVKAAVTADPRMNEILDPGDLMPFDDSRRIYGGFKILMYL